jgi:hypothetical protein
MAAAWFLLQTLVIFFYKNLHEFNQENGDVSDAIIVNNTNYLNEQDETSNLIVSCDNEISIDKGNDLIAAGSTSQSYQNNTNSIRTVKIVDNSETGSILLRLYSEYIRDEVVAVYFAAFAVIFMQTSLETFLTPFTKDYFNWTEEANSILYAVCGVEIMIVFSLLVVISKKISDRVLLVTGLVGNLSTLIFLIFWLPTAIPGRNQIADYLCFSVPVFFNVFSLPLIVIPSISLLSKVTNMNSQGLTQG